MKGTTKPPCWLVPPLASKYLTSICGVILPDARVGDADGIVVGASDRDPLAPEDMRDDPESGMFDSQGGHRTWGFRVLSS